MTLKQKKEVLQILHAMLTDWQSWNEETTDEEFEKLYIRLGFCFWLTIKFNNWRFKNRILSTLLADCENSISPNLGYWYPSVYFSYYVQKEDKPKIKERLQPRIKHLQRTIKRLETTPC